MSEFNPANDGSSSRSHRAYRAVADDWKDAGRERRERLEREDDRATRARLERQSPRTARVDIVARLNAMALLDGARQAPGLDAINAIRKAQQRTGYLSASDHNRAYARLEKSEGFNRLHPERGGMVTRRTDSGGSLESGDARARDQWPWGEVEAIEAEWLLSAARAPIEAVRTRALRFPEGRRD